MLSTLSYQELAAQVNTKFRLAETPEPLEIELIEATEPEITPRQEMFSLFFQGPKDFLLPQRTYQLTHEILGDGALFLVPVGQTEAGYKYEAVFNRMINQNS